VKLKEIVTMKDGNGEKYEVIEKSNNIITIKTTAGQVFNIPSVYLVDYTIWQNSNKKEFYEIRE